MTEQEDLLEISPHSYRFITVQSLNSSLGTFQASPAAVQFHCPAHVDGSELHAGVWLQGHFRVFPLLGLTRA